LGCFGGGLVAPFESLNRTVLEDLTRAAVTAEKPPNPASSLVPGWRAKRFVPRRRREVSTKRFHELDELANKLPVGVKTSFQILDPRQQKRNCAAQSRVGARVNRVQTLDYHLQPLRQYRVRNNSNEGLNRCGW
jgi:hypothetical protein